VIVPTKTPEQQSGFGAAPHASSVHPSADRGDQCKSGPILPSSGIVAPVGRHGVEELLNVRSQSNDKRRSANSSCVSLGTRGSIAQGSYSNLEFDRLIQGLAPNLFPNGFFEKISPNNFPLSFVFFFSMSLILLLITL